MSSWSPFRRAQLPLALFLFGLMSFRGHGWVPAWSTTLLEFAAGCFVLSSVVGRSPVSRTRWAFALISLIGGIALERSRSGLALTTLGLSCALLCLAFRQDTRVRLRTRALFPVLGLLMLLRVALTLPAGYELESLVSAGTNVVASIVTFSEIDLGPTYGGARGLVVALCLWLLLHHRRRSRWAVGAILLTAATVVATLITAGVASILPPFGSGEDGLPGRLPASCLPWIPTLLLLATWVGLCRALPPSRLRISRPGWIAVTGTLLLGTLLTFPPPRREAPRSFALYEEGFHSWGRPTDEIFGEYSAGMLGTLPDFLQATGAEAEIVPTLTPEVFAKHDAVVLINLDHDLGRETLERMEDFVRSGGRLFVIGDHTFLKESDGVTKIYLNDPLESTHIRFWNDSADPISPAWDGGSRFLGLGQPFTSHHGNPSGILVGGSLETSWPARPVVAGVHGYSDVGIPADSGDRKGFLGDLVWNPGERLGEMTLVAAEPVGQGWVYAVGDTTGVTNMGRTFRWDFASRLFTGRFEESRALYTGLAALLLLALGSGLVSRIPRPDPGPPRLLRAAVHPASILFCVVLSTGIFELVRGPDAGGFLLGRGKQPLGLVDTTACPEGRLGSWHMEGLLSLPVNLAREGYLPLVAHRTPPGILEASDLIFVIAPRIDPGRRWQRRILDAVSAGTRLILAAGYEEARTITPLLEELDVAVLPTVHGPLPARWKDSEGEWRQASSVETWQLDLRSPAWTPLLTNRDRVVIASRPWGRGEIVFAADSRMFRNVNLEGKHGVRENNLRLLRDLIRNEVGDLVVAR